MNNKCQKCKERNVIAKNLCSRCYYAVKNGWKCDFERKKEQNFSRNGLYYLGSKFIVDKDVYEKYKKVCWTNNGEDYAKNGRLGYLHRIICPQYKSVDHINRNTFDNRRKNLREGLYINVLNTDKRKTPYPIYKNKQGLWYGQTQIEGKKFYVKANKNKSVIIKEIVSILKSANRLSFYKFT